MEPDSDAVPEYDGDVVKLPAWVREALLEVSVRVAIDRPSAGKLHSYVVASLVRKERPDIDAWFATNRYGDPLQNISLEVIHQRLSSNPYTADP